MTALLTARGLTRRFGSGALAKDAVADVDLDVRAGELLVLRGRSGSGKTTLLSMLGALDRPTSGSVVFDGIDLGAAGEDELVRLRRERFGFVFQGFGLVPLLTAAENVEVPLRLRRVPAAERDARVAAMLDRVGLGEHGLQRPGELSGGQQQRVGIARALVGRPAILFADEPTGQLDSATGAAMIDLLVATLRDDGAAAVICTHDDQVAAVADQVVELVDGRRTHPDAAVA